MKLFQRKQGPFIAINTSFESRGISDVTGPGKYEQTALELAESKTFPDDGEDDPSVMESENVEDEPVVEVVTSALGESMILSERSFDEYDSVLPTPVPPTRPHRSDLLRQAKELRNDDVTLMSIQSQNS